MYERVYDVPAGLVWHTPPVNAGGIVVVSYAENFAARTPATRGALYRCRVDRSDNSVEYAKLDLLRQVRRQLSEAAKVRGPWGVYCASGRWSEEGFATEEAAQLAAAEAPLEAWAARN